MEVQVPVCGPSDPAQRDPDPISIALGALGAIGSVASIVALVQGKNRDRLMDERFQRQDRADLVEHLANAEASLAELASVLARAKLLARSSEIADPLIQLELSPEERGPIAFGSGGLLLTPSGIELFLQLQDQAFRHARSAQRSLSSAFKVLYRTEAGIPEEHFYQLVDTVRKVNAVLSNREHPAVTLQRTEEVASQLGETIHSLRVLVSQGPDSTPQQRPRFL
jgi:hypothetical protein